IRNQYTDFIQVPPNKSRHMFPFKYKIFTKCLALSPKADEVVELLDAELQLLANGRGRVCDRVDKYPRLPGCHREALASILYFPHRLTPIYSEVAYLPLQAL